MTATILIPLLVCIVGLIVYALSANAKVAELGRLAYAAGLLVTLFVVATKVVHL
jgi:hypothetical protein